MIRFLRNTVILLLPFLGMVALNEGVRPSIPGPPYSAHGITAMNPLSESKDRCSWICHNNTRYCTEHHTRAITADVRVFTDPLYWGFIRALKSTGNYGAANLLLFVVVLPLLMYFWLTRSIDIQLKIRKLKRQQ